MSTLMRFNWGDAELVFEGGGDYPAGRRTEMLQVQDRTAAGLLQVEDLGLTIKSRTIVFSLMSKVDYDALEDWFVNIARGGLNAFQFTDEYGVVRDAIFTDQILDFQETSLNRYSGSIVLEYV